jgi:Mce-associated membrane protein
MSEPAVPDAAELDPPPRPERRGGLGRWVVVGVLVAALVAVGALAIGKSGDVSRLEDDQDSRRQVAAAAATFGEVYLTYDFDDVDASSSRVVELVTPEFAEDFADTRAPGIEELFANLETSTRATTTEVFVGDVTDDDARALVVVDVDASSAASGTQRLTDLTFVLDLERIDGAWLVANVAPAPQPDIEGDQPTSTTTTTAPTTTTP